MKISIIIPCFNEVAFVERCLSSVMQQTYKNIECIIVDDGSTDESIHRCEKMIANYHGSIQFVILHHSQNKGLSAARNTGINAASGDYLFFMDNDDIITPDCLEKLVEPLYMEMYDVVAGLFDRIDEDDNHISTYNLKLPVDMVLRGRDIIDCYQRIRIKDSLWGVAVAWNKLYSTNFVLRNNLFFKEGTIMHEDELWSFEVVCLATSLYTVNQLTYHYRKREGSLCDTFNYKREAYAISVIVIEMGEFVRKWQIYNEAIHEIIQSYFLSSLRYSIRRPSEFFNLYKAMRSHVKPSYSDLFQVNKGHIKRRIRDFHYFLPCVIAFFLEYCIYASLSWFKLLNK